MQITLYLIIGIIIGMFFPIQASISARLSSYSKTPLTAKYSYAEKEKIIIERKDLRSLFGMVFQDTWLFSGTIEENIAFSREDATKEEIIKVLKVARTDHFIQMLSNGYKDGAG